MAPRATMFYLCSYGGDLSTFCFPAGTKFRKTGFRDDLKTKAF
jgi:hypothetical protein